jgi:hypothetical protein
MSTAAAEPQFGVTTGWGVAAKTPHKAAYLVVDGPAGWRDGAKVTEDR